MTTMHKTLLGTISMLRIGAVFSVPLLALSVQGGEIKEPDVVAAVETWVRHVTADARPDAAIECMEPYTVDGRRVGYVAHLVGGGYCLCGADDLVLPVYLYSPQGAYTPDNPGNQYILWEIGARLANLEKALQDNDALAKHQAALAERAAFWQELIAGQVTERPGGRDGGGEPEMMVLPLTCTWSQRSPYNDQCPDLPPGSDNRTVVGCVATAMAQIMYYWQWPWVGQGEHDRFYPYQWRDDWDYESCPNDPGIDPDRWEGRLEWVWTDPWGWMLRMNGYWDGSIYSAAEDINDDPQFLAALETLYNRLNQAATYCYADFGATTYDWSIMEDVHSDPPGSGDAEVAELCYHVGISVDMGWGLWGSGAGTGNVADALKNYFRYDPDATYIYRDINAMTDEIMWLRPIEMRGCAPDDGGCHAWVVCGYNKATDPDRQFLINMGWGGSGDGWYTYDSIQFNLGQRHVIAIAPLDVVRFVGDDDYGDGSPTNPHGSVAEALNDAPDGATLIFEAGSINYFFAGPLIIDRPLTLKGHEVTIARW